MTNCKYIGMIICWYAFAMLITTCCLAQDVGKRNVIEKVFTESINDSISVEVQLKYDDAGFPEFYFCHINTPVCEHGLCKLMVIDVYWDVLGNFLRYELPPNEPLTKFDHLEFSPEDYEQLNKILANRASILRDYPAADLIDERQPVKSDEVDAVSAATRAEVKNEIVSGAAYSTYTLWHIVNGEIANRIEAHSLPFINKDLLKKMFRSDNFYYQYYALNHYPAEKTEEYARMVIRLVKEGTSYIPYFAIDKVPDWAWREKEQRISLLRHFSSGDFELKNAYLNILSGIELDAASMQLLANDRSMTDKQVVRMLDLLLKNRERITGEVIKQISRFSEHPDKEIAQRARSLSKDINQ